MTPTPGQIAYEAFAASMMVRHAPWGMPDFADLRPTPDYQDAWEAAAQAVAVRAVADTLETQRLLARAVCRVEQEETPMTPRQVLDILDTILDSLARLRAALHDPLNRADLAEAQACLEDVALRLREDLAQKEAPC